MKLLLPLLAVMMLGQQVLCIEELCRECICANSGGRSGNASSCTMPDRGSCLEGVYCGPYGMTIQYWTDADSPGDNFLDCMYSWSCANETLDAYNTKFCNSQFVGHSPPCNCEEDVRLHHCGPWSMNAQFCNESWTKYFEPCITDG